MSDKKISQLSSSTTPLAGTEVLPIVQSGTTKKVSVSDLTSGRSLSFSAYTAGTSSQTTSNTVLFAYGGSSNDYGVQYRLYSGATLSATIGHDKSIFGGSSSDLSIYATTGNGFRVYTNGANQALTINTSQNIVANAGNLVIGTAAKGIDFSANTGAAGETSSLLDWYEEGTWTATLSDGTNNATMSSATCRYVRIGRHITVNGYVSITSRGSLSGSLRITGLPFTCANANDAYAGGAVTYASGLDITAGQSVTVVPEINTTYMLLYVWAGTSGTSQMQNTQWTDSGAIMFSATYSV